MSEWISVKDRLPPNADQPGALCPRYWVNTKYGTAEGWYNPDKKAWYVLLWFLLGRFDEQDIDMTTGDIPEVAKCPDACNIVTHWMPLPELPEEEK